MGRLRSLQLISRKIWHPRVFQYHTESGVYGYPAEKPQKDVPVEFIRAEQAGVARLVDNFRTHGYKEAQLDLLGLQKQKKASELEPRFSGLEPSSNASLDASNLISGVSNANSISLMDLEGHLKACYCGQIAAEFMHLQSYEEREWFAHEFESLKNVSFSPAEKLKFAELLIKSQVSCDDDVKQVMIGIAHRGRLNLLTLLLKFPPVLMFQKVMDTARFWIPDSSIRGPIFRVSSLDLSLEGCSSDLHVTMLPNPSHLEAVDPVAAGKVRGRLQSLKLGDYSPDGDTPNTGVMCFQIHGDGSFTGQGVVPETLALSQVPHFRTGGSLHLIINNQVGFTTEKERGRSSDHCSDVAKAVHCPVIHVNGEYPELLAKAAMLSVKYRQQFENDVFVNMFCFRRWGHNEMDDPSFTQPIMYDVIGSRKSVPDLYAESLIAEGILTEDKKLEWIAEHNQEMANNLKEVETQQPRVVHLNGLWSGFSQAPDRTEIWDTGVDIELLKFVGAKSVDVPENITVHPHLGKMHSAPRLKKLEEGTNLDWATAEALAFGSLLSQGFFIRISGQDVGRGTFSHRHVMLVDRETDHGYVPLNHMIPDQKGFIEVANSILSEEAVMGFEYGMSVENPNRLCIWEAQFGDFMNGAQIIIDTCVSSGEDKWLMQSGLVLLLPHGYDGAGPEHSSCRIERFLQLTDSREAGPVDGDDVNMGVVFPTTPAQYFHLLRRQMLRNYRKPLVIIGPKVLLRLPAATSSLGDMGPGTHFKTVIGDANVQNNAAVTKVIICSGKHYYALHKQRETNSTSDVAIVRVESLCPFPAQELREELNKYPGARRFVWSQEEPRNMGPWFFVKPRMENLVGIRPEYAGRPELPVVATAIGVLHQKEAESVLAQTFG